jgi:hypothetical protein
MDEFHKPITTNFPLQFMGSKGFRLVGNLIPNTRDGQAQGETQRTFPNRLSQTVMQSALSC